MARGVVGREVAFDERKRQGRISKLLLNVLRRLGGPVLKEWQAVAHDIRRVREADIVVIVTQSFQLYRS